MDGKGNFGYNALTDVYEDLVKAGVIDPAKVTKTALSNAASVSILLLTSDALIAEMPKADSKKGHGGGHDLSSKMHFTRLALQLKTEFCLVVVSPCCVPLANQKSLQIYQMIKQPATTSFSNHVAPRLA